MIARHDSIKPLFATSAAAAAGGADSDQSPTCFSLDFCNEHLSKHLTGITLLRFYNRLGVTSQCRNGALCEIEGWL